MSIANLLTDPFLCAALASLGLALASGLLGSVFLNQRTQTLSELVCPAVVFGIALALTFHVSLFAGSALLVMALALLVFAPTGRNAVVPALFGGLAYSGVAAGLALTFAKAPGSVNLDDHLFGDLSLTGPNDLAAIWLVVALAFVVVTLRWTALTGRSSFTSVSEELQTSTQRDAFFAALLLSSVVAVGIGLLGAVPLLALLVLPALCAQRLSNLAEGRATLSMCIGALVATGGIQAAHVFSSPITPTLVVVAIAFFFLTAFSSVLTRIGG